MDKGPISVPPRGAGDAKVEPRKFQIDLVEFAKRGNTIVYLETGSGKTHIAVMLIKEKLHQVLGSYKDGAKRSVFLACTVHLVEQQKAYLAKFMPPEIRVEAFIGARGVDFWSEDTWSRELELNHVLVMSPQILVDAMYRNMVDPSRINVIVFDECHRATEKHPYREAMRRIFEATENRPQDRPLVLGLTASVLNDKGATIAQNRATLEKLEKTFQAAVFGPREAADSQMYKTCAREYLVMYRNAGTSTKDPLLERLRELTDTAGEYAAKHKALMKRTINGDIDGTPLITTSNVADDFKKLFLDWSEAHTSLGLIASRHYGECFLKECVRIEKDNTFIPENVRELMRKGTVLSKDIGRALTSLGDDVDQVTEGVTDKVKRLVELLAAYEPKTFPAGMSIDDRLEMDNQSLRGIVFVQRRSTCEILLKILQVHSMVTGELGFLRIGTAQGHTAPASIFRNKGGRGLVLSNDRRATEDILTRCLEDYNQWLSEGKKQASSVMQFRNGDLNLLIATDVLEEGVDVPSCNLIVRFDRAVTFRSYVQSRGRARYRDARFVFFAAASEAHEIMDTLCRWHASESELIDACSSRVVPTEAEVKKSFQDRKLKPFAPFGPTGPVIDASSAVTTVYRYVERYGVAYKPFFTMKSFVVDPRVSLDVPVRSRRGFNGPIFKYSPVHPENVCQAWLEDGEDPFGVGAASDVVSYLEPTLYKVSLYFPSVTSVAANSRCLESDYCDSVKEAKQSVCLDACRLLWKMGELDDDHLLPKPLDLTLGVDVTEDDVDGEDDDDSAADDSYKNLQIFPNLLAKGLNNTRPKAGSKLFLYKLVLTTVSSNPEHVIADAWNPSGAPLGVGLLSRKRLPEVEDFELYPKQATVRVSLELLSEGTAASQDQIKLLESFYAEVVVRHVWEVNNPLIGFDSKRAVDGPLYVPIDNGKREVAFEFAAKAVQGMSSWRTTPPVESGLEAFEDAVVVSDYDAKNKYHVVLEVDRKLSPDSILAANETYRNRVKLRHQRTLCWKDQPLLRCAFMTRLLFMLKSRFGSDEQPSPPRDGRDEVHLIPEICRISPVPASLWLQLLLLPSAHRRVDCLMKAAELRRDVGIGVDYGSDAERPKLMDIAVVPLTPATSFIQSLTLPSPPVSAVLEAVTAKQTNELFDYERYETLGDAMLKFVATLDLFLRWPTETEGQLTSAKSRLVSNGYLEKLNTKKKMNEYWNVAPLCPRESWLPPLFFQPDYVDQLFLNSDLRQNEWDVSILQELVKTNGFTSLSTDLVTAAVTRCQEAVKSKAGKTNALLHRLQNNYLVRKKVMADVVESLAGVYLAWSGLSSGWNFFREWAGMPLFEWDELTLKVASPSVNEEENAGRAGLLKRVEGLQTRLKYNFNDPMFLVQALTHPSYYAGNVCTRAYERLEFLGDAVLDYLVTVAIFDDPRICTPEKISDLRSALTNNETLACIAVENRLHTYILVTDEVHVTPIRRFADFVSGIDWKTSDFTVPTVGGGTKYVHVPKSLADVQEALIGAVFLDSGLDLKVVWQVFEPWFHDVMEAYSDDIPCNPVKMAMEKLRAEFISEERDDQDRAVVTCKVKIRNREIRGTGIGENTRSAKIAAANQVIRECKRLGFL